MVSGKYRSRSLRRVYVKTPRQGTKLSYRKRKSGSKKCAYCHASVKDKASRSYGNLCSRCSRRKIIKLVR